MDNKVFYHWNEPESVHQYRTGVSLHSHTNHSQEGLEFIPRLSQRIPFAHWALTQKISKCSTSTGIKVDLDNAYWTPPLTARMAYDLEAGQITEKLRLSPLVSLTDHDTIEANSLLTVMEGGSEVPISVEWSVLFHGVMLHLGIHNLPHSRAQMIMSHLAAYTADPQRHRLGELIESLHLIPGVLIVMNHPLWDLYGNGDQVHRNAVGLFLKKHGQFVHALELNGLRSWEENRKVRQLAEGWNLPTISGGDRHGCEPNATLNLTNAATFAEFAEEVRKDRMSHVLLMPQYMEPIQLRILQTVLDAVREYPARAPEEQRWDGRVFHPSKDGTCLPLRTMWHKGSPFFIEAILFLLRQFERGLLRNALRYTLHDEKKIRMALEPVTGATK